MTCGERQIILLLIQVRFELFLCLNFGTSSILVIFSICLYADRSSGGLKCQLWYMISNVFVRIFYQLIQWVNEIGGPGKGKGNYKLLGDVF